jgi:hypothetical protein
MNTTMGDHMLAGFVLGLAMVGLISVFGFFLGVFQEWYDAKRKINRDVPDLQDGMSELRIKVTLLDSAVKRLERSPRHDRANGQALLDEPHSESTHASL